jgi:hypothetical protein
LSYGKTDRRQEQLVVSILNHFNAMPQSLWRDLATLWLTKSSRVARRWVTTCLVSTVALVA